MAQRNTLVSISRFIAQQVRHLFVCHRSVPAFLESDQTGGAPEFPLRSLFERNEPDDRFTRLGDDNLLPRPCLSINLESCVLATCTFTCMNSS